ncbi:MAG: hypothetical protein AAF560_23205 [Acidobacteriota bacterium]
MNETTTLSGEVTLTVVDAEGRKRHQSSHRNRVFSAGTQHVASCLVGEINSQTHWIEIGSGQQPDSGEDLDQLHELLRSNPVSSPEANGSELTFTAVFNAGEPMEVAESGLRFKYSRIESEEEVLYNRAVIDPPVVLNSNDRIRVQWKVFFDWIQLP